jgi:uroporphyrinogen III methyltransferase/synthase
MEPRPRGFVHLVGAGPGDPGLLTRRGAEALAGADVVVFDHLVHSRLVDLAPAAAERIDAGKRAGHCALPQDEINALLVERARRGLRVVRLKGGDPLIFGRGGEEAAVLRGACVPFAIVPGVTAAAGVAAYAGFPITHRAEASAVAFLTGHHDPTADPGRLDWDALARFPGTLAIYMGVSRLAALARLLVDRGKAADTPAAMVQWGTLPRQRTVVATLGTLADRVAEARLGAPALVLIGPIIGRRDDLSWFEELPLFGRRIVVTRPAEEAGRAAEGLEALGAEALVAPTVAIAPPDDFGPLDAALDRLAEFDWLVFTSPNGVRATLDRLLARGRDLRALGSLRLAAIGPATAEALRGYHLVADLVPPEYRSESLAESLRTHVAGRRVLLARADRGRAVLTDALGPIARVEQVATYRNVDADALPPDVAGRLAAGEADWITVTSPAVVRRLHALLPAAARERVTAGTIRLASLSPVTSDAAREVGWGVAAEAETATWDGLVAALIAAEEARPASGQATSR